MTGRHLRPSSGFEQLSHAWLSTRRSANTSAAYGADLRRFASWCVDRGIDPLDASTAELQGFRVACEATGGSGATVARRLSAVGSFLRFAARHGVPGAADSYPGVRRPVARVASATATLSDHEAAALLEAADALHPKAALLVRLLMLDGLKVGEAVRADADDLGGRPPRMALRLERQGAPHVLRLHLDTARAAGAYLGRRREGPLLLGEGPIHGDERLTRFGADYVVKRAAVAAGLTVIVSGNTLRRRYIERARANGTDIDEIRRHVGHLDERTTRRFLDPDQR
jgi:site-specific recombinase XerD